MLINARVRRAFPLCRQAGVRATNPRLDRPSPDVTSPLLAFRCRPLRPSASEGAGGMRFSSPANPARAYSPVYRDRRKTAPAPMAPRRRPRPAGPAGRFSECRPRRVRLLRQRPGRHRPLTCRRASGTHFHHCRYSRDGSRPARTRAPPKGPSVLAVFAHTPPPAVASWPST